MPPRELVQSVVAGQSVAPAWQGHSRSRANADVPIRRVRPLKVQRRLSYGARLLGLTTTGAASMLIDETAAGRAELGRSKLRNAAPADTTAIELLQTLTHVVFEASRLRVLLCACRRCHKSYPLLRDRPGATDPWDANGFPGDVGLARGPGQYLELGHERVTPL